jgi:hypothetical protein
MLECHINIRCQSLQVVGLHAGRSILSAETEVAAHYIQCHKLHQINQLHSSDAALPTIALRAKREYRGLGEDPPDSPMMTHQQVPWTCPHTRNRTSWGGYDPPSPLDLSAQTPNRTSIRSSHELIIVKKVQLYLSFQLEGVKSSFPGGLPPSPLARSIYSL